jgi:hypothetical protein
LAVRRVIFGAVLIPTIAMIFLIDLSSVHLDHGIAGSLGTARTYAQALSFLWTFDGQPTTPIPWNPAAWDVQVHTRQPDRWKTLDQMDAQHGADCGAPPAVHRIMSYEDAVFICRDHMMTAINSVGVGYGAIYLTPNQIVDFTNGEAVVRFDVSTLRTSTRDWIDLWITPFRSGRSNCSGSARF